MMTNWHNLTSPTLIRQLDKEWSVPSLTENATEEANIPTHCNVNKDTIEIVDPNIGLESNPTNIVEECVECPEQGGEVIVPKKRKLHTCLICSQSFTQLSYKYLHMRKAHNIFGSEKASVKCLETGCTFKCGYKEKLQWHLSDAHNIKMVMTLKKLNSLSEFDKWKEDFELQEKCRFVKKSGSRPKEGGVIMSYYYCNRSGAYVSQGKGLKQGKRKGSAKSNNHCTASITSMELPNGKVDVKICSTHYGHDTELQHLRLSRSEKFRIAEQLCRGVPRELVLDEVRASAGPKVERIHLITMKDIKNIEKAYGIQSTSNVKEEDMFGNLHDWVSNMMLLENSPVLFFQEEGLPNTLNHDVTLIILTKGQIEALQKYGNKGTFFVSTTVLSNSNAQSAISVKFKPKHIYITTVMVVDEINECFPVSFMVSNQSKDRKYELLFESLKKKVPTISATIVLTDCMDEIYKWWCTVFEEVPNHYWSNRFIDVDWRENLISIVDEDLQVSIYERLYSYLESPDSNLLLTSLKSYISALQLNPLAIKFTDHFIKRYLGSEKFWAGCYGKLDVPVSAQLNMEVFCNDLLEICEKKYWDRKFVVKIIQNLLKIANDKQCERQSKLDRQIQEMARHHELGVAIKPEYVINECHASWRVESVKDPKNIFARVNQQNPECANPTKCGLLCTKCNACAHQMKCSCRVHIYDRTMCKHIHAVAINYFSSNSDSVVKAGIENEPEKSNKTEVEKEPAKSTNNKDIKTKSVKRKRGRSAKKIAKQDESTGVKGVLPVIEDLLSNRLSKKPHAKGKRGRPPKNKQTESVIIVVEEDEKNENTTRHLRKRKKPNSNQEPVAVEDKNCNEGTPPKKSQRRGRRKTVKTDTETVTNIETESVRRINILRKFVKKSY